MYLLFYYEFLSLHSSGIAAIVMVARLTLTYAINTQPTTPRGRDILWQREFDGYKPPLSSYGQNVQHHAV
jgi:hypothetical protein